MEGGLYQSKVTLSLTSLKGKDYHAKPTTIKWPITTTGFDQHRVGKPLELSRELRS